MTALEAAKGARPEGATTDEEAAIAVQKMFDEIAPQYDRANHILSMGMDRVWWNSTARFFDATLQQPQSRVLDLCCGTADMTAALLARRPANSEPVLAVDFSHEMIERGRIKMQGKPVEFIEADALNLPLEDASLDLVVSAFGFRNLTDYNAGLREIRRVLKPGGRIGILDFSMPPAPLKQMYRLYFRHVLPRIGGIISGSQDSYAYLPASVERFPAPKDFLRMMETASFTATRWQPYLFGIAGLWSATAL
ncbi:bifunctional demethylmenaquinone methyltransferase/2-methoxy-6-polyprenyl-1,4-benzoquinol methylase UbiE [Terriglobus sp. RCC_193]|uniref:bifunctional demethylmenaquinone methyltransferase/2-methoxy-6-polyprenyl-1,4-benzoquinol methylase UbiE n=1 Tax=Terriglobus sp. RCC_193 TaxID=3239218 RepID=UPI0035233269